MTDKELIEIKVRLEKARVSFSPQISGDIALLMNALDEAQDEIEELHYLDAEATYGAEAVMFDLREAKAKAAKLNKMVDWLSFRLAQTRQRCPLGTDYSLTSAFCKTQKDCGAPCWRKAAERAAEACQ